MCSPYRMQRVWANPEHYSFDNIGMAVFSIFQSLQMEGFFATMYALQDSHSSASWAYMVAIMLRGLGRSDAQRDGWSATA